MSLDIYSTMYLLIVVARIKRGCFYFGMLFSGAGVW